MRFCTRLKPIFRNDSPSLFSDSWTGDILRRYASTCAVVMKNRASSSSVGFSKYCVSISNSIVCTSNSAFVRCSSSISASLNAIRSDEELGNLHSLYVDQWDWERVITDEDRNVNFLKEIVNRIYAAMIRTEYMVYEMYPQIKPCLPQKLHFIHSEELRQLYPNLEPKCREHAICQKYGAVFIIGIGCKLSDGKKHDGRAPDYDDYTTNGLNGLPGLNGDLLLWDDVLQRSIELSSMGIRVDKEALQRQLKEEHEEKRLELYFHKRLMNDTLPLSIGGGIGQSRLCMFYLRKAHIGEIQASIWPEDMRKECEELDIHLI